MSVQGVGFAINFISRLTNIFNVEKVQPSTAMLLSSIYTPPPPSFHCGVTHASSPAVLVVSLTGNGRGVVIEVFYVVNNK